jgi:hypothetical protein
VVWLAVAGKLHLRPQQSKPAAIAPAGLTSRVR